jgi:hypothetical protein
VDLLAPAEAELQLGLATLVDVDPERDERQALRLRLAEELVDLGPMEEQLPVPFRLVVLAAGALPRGDVGPDEPGLAALDPGEGIGQVDLAGPDRLDLGAGQGDAGLDRVFDRELVSRPAIDRDRLLGNWGAPRLPGTQEGCLECTNAGPNGPAFACGRPPAGRTY